MVAEPAVGAEFADEDGLAQARIGDDLGELAAARAYQPKYSLMPTSSDMEASRSSAQFSSMVTLLSRTSSPLSGTRPSRAAISRKPTQSAGRAEPRGLRGPSLLMSRQSQGAARWPLK